MPLTRVCPQCGAALPTEGWEGLCPKCLVRVSLEMAGGEAEAGHRPAAPSAGGRPEGVVRPSSIAKIADPKSTTEPPRTRCVGDYELLEEIARGGMGVVYRARQLSLNRIVAVKMMLSGQFASAADVLRFRSEAEAAANLDHPNIVAIHEVGEHDGQQYFSMDYVEGRNLAEVVRERPLGARPAAQYVKIIAEAIHYAHRCGTLHRDLKPSNVLIDAADQPRITDFGLAKRVTESSPATARSGNPTLEMPGPRSPLVDPRADLTLTGQVLGSPNFMPPEQAVGRRGEVGPHSDVYSLGAILYHLLTGRPPFLAETFTEVLQQVQQVDAISPRLLHPAVPRDLETICLKCLEKEPRRRYATAEELAEELRRFLSGEPVRARPLGSTAKAWRWCRRKPALAGALAACAAAVVLGVGGIAWQWRRAQGKANESRTRLVRQYVMNGNRQVSQGDFAGALPWFAEALKLEANIPARAEMHRLRLTLAAQRCPKPVQIWSHQAGLNYAEFSPDGRWVVVACDDQVALVWDAMTAHPVGPPLPHTGRVLYATWAPDGAHLATACADATARVWNVTNANPLLWTLKHSGPVVHAKFNHDGSRLVTSSDDATAQVWDVQTGAAVLPALKHKEGVRHAEFSPDDLWIVTAGDDKSVRLWDAATGQSVGPTMWRSSVVRHAEFSSDGRRILMLGEKVATVFDRIKNHYYETQHEHSLLAGAFSPDGNNFVVGGMGYGADLFNTADGKAIGHSLDHSAEVMDVRFSPDGRFLITASRDRTARVWDRSGAPATGPLWHLKPVTHAAFSPDGHHALSVSEDQMIRIWELSRSLPEIPTLHPVTVVSHAAFNSDNRRLLTVGLNGAVDLWDWPARVHLAPVLTSTGTVRHATFSPDGRWLAAGTAEGWAQVWDLATGAPVSPLLFHTGAVNHVEFSPDGTRLASASSDGSACVWDIASGRAICRLPHPQPVRLAKFTPDGQEIVTATVNAHLYALINQFAVSIHDDIRGEAVWVGRWNVQTGRPVVSLVRLPVRASRVEFSPDRRQLVTSVHGLGLGTTVTHGHLVPADVQTRQVQVWDVLTGRPTSAKPLQHADLITSAVFSPDGQRVVTASADHTARVWDVRTGQPLTAPLEHEEEVRGAAFAADGRLVVTAGADRTARVWDAATGEPVSPPLKHNPKLTGVFVGIDSRHFLTTTMEPWSLLWTLPEDTRPVKEHLRRAQLLAGRQVDDTGGLTFLTADAMARLWQELTATDRSEADATVQQVSAWQQYWTDTVRRQEYFKLKRSAAGHARNNELNEALEGYNQVIADNPDDYEAYELRSEVHLRRREAVEAEADLKRAIELNPYFEEGYFRLVFLYLDRNPVHSHERALEAALKMAALNHSQTAFSMLGQAYYRAGRYQEAITTLNNDLKVDIEELKVIDSLFLAMSHQRLGDPSKAEQYYEKARQWRQSKKDSDIATNGRERFDQCLAETEKVLGKPASRPRATNPPAK